MRVSAPSTPLRRAAAAASTAALVALTTAAVAAPASASTIDVTDAASWAAALDTAESNGVPDTINVLADFAVPGEYQNYSENQDLTIEGNGHTISWDGTTAGAALIAHREDTLEASFVVRGLTFTGFDSAGWGALFLAAEGTIELDGITVTDNIMGPGVLLLSGDDVTVTDSLIANNSNEDDFYLGFIEGGAGLQVMGYHTTAFTTTISGSTFADNVSVERGGALYSESDTTVIEDSSFVGNVAGENGGAIYAPYELTVNRSLFADNEAADGGAIMASGEAATIGSSTFDGNTASGSGGAVASDSHADILMGFTTLTDNTAGSSADHAFTGGTLSIVASVVTGGTGDACVAMGITSGYTFDEDGTCTLDWSSEGDLGDGLDAQLGALADNGGGTFTRLPAETSPLVDAIPLEQCQAALESDEAFMVEYDQRGASRADAVSDGNLCDIGAVETYVASVVDDSDDDATEDEDADSGEETDSDTAGTGDEVDVLTAVIPTAAGDVTLTVTGATSIVSSDGITVAEAGGTPAAGVAYPMGALAYTFTVANPGDTVEVTLSLPRPATGLWKTGDAWTEVTAAAVSDSGMTITYTITDGGDLDEDGAADGTIVDPAAPGVSATFTG